MALPRKGAEILVDALITAGVQVIFGVPGDTGVVFYDALYARGGELRHILARDERAAAAMADAYARLTNQIGVVEASSGGGATYLVGGLGEPFAASVPILVLTTDIPRESRGSGAITEVDQSVLFAAVTKWRHTIESAAEIPAAVQEAIRTATSGRPGPVSLVLPENVLDEQAEARQIAVDSRVPRERPEADWAVVREVAQSLSVAERPAIVAGSGVHMSQAWEELARFAEQCGVPVATTIHGKGAYVETNPWSLGVVGGNGARDYANDYLAEADWVLFAGTRANATDTNGYTAPPRGGDAFIAQVDIYEERIGRNYPGARALLGDLRTVLEQLSSVASDANEEWRAELLRRVAYERNRWEAGHRRLRTAQGLDPREVVIAVQRASRQDSLVVADAGTPTPYLAAFWQCREPGRSVLIPRGHGAMGFAIPAAVGASIARPGTPVLALTTDGSFAMACGELETARRLDLPITFIHLANGSYGWIKMLQYLYMGQRYIGVDFAPVAAEVVAKGFGLPSWHVASVSDLGAALQESQRTEGPGLIDVAVATEMDLLPPVAPWQAALAGNLDRPAY